jgi:hypothetical protein
MKLNLNMSSFSKRAILFAIGFLVLIFNSSRISAQHAVTWVNDLEFGNFSNWGSGTLTISADANSTVTHSTNVIDLPNALPKITPKSGLITVQFSKGDTYSKFKVTYSSSIDFTYLTNKITFVPSPASGTVVNDQTNAAKFLPLYIGGTLTFTQQMPAGHYTASSPLIVKVTYNY